MEPASADASHVVMLLCLSVVMLLFHIMLQGLMATRELGTDWNAGPRDDAREPQGVMAGRAARASRNFQETYPAFVGLLLGLAFMGDATGFGIAGGWGWLICRVVYIPLYLGGIPYVRSFVWLGSLVGLAMMACGILF